MCEGAGPVEEWGGAPSFWRPGPWGTPRKHKGVAVRVREQERPRTCTVVPSAQKLPSGPWALGDSSTPEGGQPWLVISGSLQKAENVSILLVLPAESLQGLSIWLPTPPHLWFPDPFPCDTDSELGARAQEV